MVDVVAAPSSPQVGAQSYVEWGAVIGGALAALATSFVLLNFGAAVGFASVSPWTSTATGLKAVGVGAAFWFLLVTIWASALGGYLAGRLRHRWNDANRQEVEFRDSAHGLLVWSLAVLLGAYLAATGVTAIGKGLGNAASGLAATSDPITATTDLLLRTDKSAPPDVSETSRAEISRLLVRSAQAGEVAPTDKTYLAQIVTARAGNPSSGCGEKGQRSVLCAQDRRRTSAKDRRCARIFDRLHPADWCSRGLVGRRHRRDAPRRRNNLAWFRKSRTRLVGAKLCAMLFYGSPEYR